MPVRCLLGTILVLQAAALVAPAQDAAEPQTRLLSRRAAEADAYRKLAEVVYGLQINSQTYVRDFVTESDEIRADVDEFIRGVRLSEPIYHDDGLCEVPAEVTVAKVVETLQTVHEQRYRGRHIDSSDFESISRRTDKKVFRVLGLGAPREDLPPGLPEGVAEMLAPPPATGGSPRVPEIWRRIAPQARLMALRAAELDAKRRVAERIKGLRLTSNTLVRDFVAESDVITTELSAHLRGAREVSRYLHDDELLAEVTVRVPAEQVITSITELHRRCYEGDDLEVRDDFERVVNSVVRKDFQATGMGVPPERFIRKYVREPSVEAPEWIADRIEAEGFGTDKAFATAQGRLKAARAAELDARRKLAQRIAALPVDAEITVKTLAAQHVEISGLVDALKLDAAVTQTRFTEQTAIVTVSLPGMRVWGVVHDALRHRP